MSSSTERGDRLAATIEELVAANRILANEGVLDGFGHVSARHPYDADRLLIARSIAPALVTAADIVICDLDGQVEGSRRSYVERFIHCEIYRARADVQAVVHSHSPALIPFGVTGTRLRPVCHMSGFLGGDGAPLFEMRHAVAEPTDLLIRNRALGAALATSLGSAAVALMRGHGSVVVGASVKQAVFRAVYTEANARLQLQSTALGEVTFLDAAEARLTAEANDQHLDRPWQLWLNRLSPHGDGA